MSYIYSWNTVQWTFMTVNIFLLFFPNAPFKWPKLFFHGWYLSGLILKNLEYQGLTNVL